MKTLAGILLVTALAIGSYASWRYIHPPAPAKAATSLQARNDNQVDNVQVLLTLGVVVHEWAVQKIREEFTPPEDAGPQDLDQARYSWLPESTTDFAARMYSEPWHGDGSELVTFRCSASDFAAMKVYFARECRGKWVSGMQGQGESMEEEMRDLGFNKKLFPVKAPSSSFKSLILTDKTNTFGPFVLIDAAQNRIWYLIIRT